MSDSLYASYDSYYAHRLSPAQLGGVNRAKDAKRDKWGRFLSKCYDLPAPDNHGQAGGLARARTAKRVHGRFAKKD